MNLEHHIPWSQLKLSCGSRFRVICQYILRGSNYRTEFFFISFNCMQFRIDHPTGQKLRTSLVSLLFDTLPCKYLSNLLFSCLSGCFKCLVMKGNSWKYKHGKNRQHFDIAIMILWLNQASYELNRNQIFLLPKNTTKQLSSVKNSCYWNYIYYENRIYTFSA